MFGAKVDDEAVKYVPKSEDSALGVNSDDSRGGEYLGGVAAGESPRLPWRDGSGFTSRMKIPRICLRPDR